ncbi:MAG: cation:proton antiporter, partial [Methermicoccaceae archaeon]
SSAMDDLLIVGLILLSLGIGGLLASRLKQSVIPAYVLMGLLLGPYGLSVVEPCAIVNGFATIGLVLLLLFIGLEFSLKQLLGSYRSIAYSGTIDLIVSMGAGVLIGYLAALGTYELAFMAGIVYVSSSGIVAKALVDFKRVANPEAEVILGIMVFEDIVMAVYMALLMAIVGAHGRASIENVAMAIGLVLVFLMLTVLVSTRLNHLISKMIDISSDELFLLVVLGVVLLFSVLASRFGISSAVGAFLVGLILSETEQAERVKEKLLPIKDVFASFFFFSFGLMIDPRALVALAPLLAIAVGIAVASKLFGGIAAARISGLSWRASLATGMGITPRGEFSLVLSQLAVASGLSYLIAPFTAGFVLLTSILGVVLTKYSDDVYAALSRVRGKL